MIEHSGRDDLGSLLEPPERPGDGNGRTPSQENGKNGNRQRNRQQLSSQLPYRCEHLPDGLLHEQNPSEPSKVPVALRFPYGKQGFTGTLRPGHDRGSFGSEGLRVTLEQGEVLCRVDQFPVAGRQPEDLSVLGAVGATFLSLPDHRKGFLNIEDHLQHPCEAASLIINPDGDVCRVYVRAEIVFHITDKELRRLRLLPPLFVILAVVRSP